jgi:hypothetical protein
MSRIFYLGPATVRERVAIAKSVFDLKVARPTENSRREPRTIGLLVDFDGRQLAGREDGPKVSRRQLCFSLSRQRVNWRRLQDGQQENDENGEKKSATY